MQYDTQKKVSDTVVRNSNFVHKVFMLIFTMLMMCFSLHMKATIVNVSNVSQLINAVNNGAQGDTISVAAGTYELTASLTPRTGMTIRGAGIANTILKPASSWNPGTKGLPYDPTNSGAVNISAYMFNLGGRDGDHLPDGNDHISISDMTLDGRKQLQGAVFGFDANYLKIYNMYLHDYTFCGIRVISSTNLVVHDNEFINMAIDGMDPEAGGIVFAYLSNSEIYNNQFYFATHGVYYGAGVNAGNYFGIKGRQLRQSRIHHNTIMVHFAIELPFENDEDVEIDHNYMSGWISVPRDWDGGATPTSGVGFHIHHNYFSKGAILEYPRNCVEVDHNLIDNDRNEPGVLFTSQPSALMTGPTKIHDNLIKNPGMAIAEVWQYNNFQFYNNHLISTPNAGNTWNGALWDVCFKFSPSNEMDHRTCVFKDNIFDCSAFPRKLFWGGMGSDLIVQNNTMINVTDTANYSNPNTGAKRGPLAPLGFTCGTHGSYTVNQWTILPSGLAAIPDAPSNLSAKSVSDTKIDLIWTDNAINETNFKIERKTGAGGTYSQVGIGGSDNPIYHDIGLTAGTMYCYRIRANNDAGNSEYSNEAIVTTISVNTIPATPSNLTAYSYSISQVDLVWSDNANNEGGFKIECKTELGGQFSTIAIVGPSVKSYSNNGLAANTRYYYRVCAYNASGNSAYSNESEAFTANPLPCLSATASSLEGKGYESALAIDGKPKTCWSSAFSDPQWIYVDLGKSCNINRVRVFWEAAYASSYQIQVSNDATNWSPIYRTKTGDGHIDDLTGLSGSGRYVRMYGTSRGTGYGYSIYEFEVYGN